MKTVLYKDWVALDINRWAGDVILLGKRLWARTHGTWNAIGHGISISSLGPLYAI